MRRPPINFTRLTATVLGGAPARREKLGRSILSRLMKEVAAQMQAFGCILWRSEDGGASFSLMAGWFDVPPGEMIPLARFTGEGSCAAKALSDGTVLEHDIRTIDNPNKDHPFLVKHGVTRAVGVRVQLNFDPIGDGVLLVYRQREDFEKARHASRKIAFTDRDLTRLRKLAIPALHLYQAASQQTALFLTRRVSQIFHKAPPLPSDKRFESLLRQYAQAVQRAFGCIEVSVFLENTGAPGVYRCKFSTKGPHHHGAMKDNYKPGLTEGFSGLALLSGEPVRVSDLKDPAAELKRIRSDPRFKEFRGHRGLEVQSAMDRKMGADAKYPHSLLVMPLESRGRIYGFVRCSVVRDGPAYFVDEDTILLQQAARPLSRWLGRKHEAWNTRQAERRLLGGVHKIGRNIKLRGTARRTKDGVFAQALSVIEGLLPEAGLNSVRLLKDEHLVFDTLSVVEGAPGAKVALEGCDFASVIERREKLTDSTSYGREVMDDPRRVIDLRSGQFDPLRYKAVAPGVEHLIIVGIVCAGKARGLLDLRCFDPAGFPAHAMPFAKVVAGLLGLQLELVEQTEAQMASERSAESQRLAQEEDKLSRDREVADAFLQVAHQLKGPLADARRYCERFSEPGASRPTTQDIFALQTRIRRSEIFSKMVGVYADLARGESIRVRGRDFAPVEVARIIGTQVAEAIHGERAEKKILHLDFDRDSILKKAPTGLRLDEDLFIQAFHALLDNALKYSRSRTTIRVFARHAGKGSFALVVESTGHLVLSKDGAKHATDMGWRDPLARLTQGEGSGLGLFLANQIMLAHGGICRILPTTPRGVTEAALIF